MVPKSHGDFHSEKRSNREHASKTDPEALLARKGEGKEAKLSYSGNLLVENRNGLIVNAMVWEPIQPSPKLKVTIYDSVRLAMLVWREVQSRGSLPKN
jgi:hypothetical protein